MKKISLWLAAIVLVFGLSACTGKSEPEQNIDPVVTETPQEENKDTNVDINTDLETNTDADIPETDIEIDTNDNTDEESQKKLSNEEATSSYKQMIQRMDNESPVDVFDDMIKLLPQMPDQKASILFAKFEQYLQDWSMNYTDQMYFEEGPMSDLWKSLGEVYDYETDSYELDNMSNDTHKAITESLFPHGYKFIWLEGSPYPFIDYSQLKVLKDTVPEEVMAYVLVMADETDEISSADAGLIIGWNELSRRIINTETALKIVENEALHNKLEGLYRFYTNSYMLGMNNTPVVDWESNKIIPEVLESYETTMASNQGSELANMIDQYISVLKKLDYTLPYSDQEQFQSIVKMQSEWIDTAIENLHTHE